jgi:hypothetical protein
MLPDRTKEFDLLFVGTTVRNTVISPAGVLGNLVDKLSCNKQEPWIQSPANTTYVEYLLVVRSCASRGWRVLVLGDGEGFWVTNDREVARVGSLA